MTKSEGFIFKRSLCVNCNACVAACLIENKWDNKVRSIYVFNKELFPYLPVEYLSLACNHCSTALCMNGCPANAIFRDSQTGAVVVDEIKCIGCNYCAWNCPYDAPKKSTTDKLVEKCHLCYTLLQNGGYPACASGCPTGALSYGNISNNPQKQNLSWFPDNNLSPAIEISSGSIKNSPTIIPQNKFSDLPEKTIHTKRNITNDWSLIAFSFFSMLSVSLTVSSFFDNKLFENASDLWILILAGFLSFFHLGNKFRAWRAVLHILKSPLSFEIAAYIVHLFTLALSLYIKNGLVSILTLCTGIAFLLAIDSVYSFQNRNENFIRHSGQVFLSGLLVGSYFSGLMLPFLFLALIKVLLSGLMFYKKGEENSSFALRFLRLILLMVVPAEILISKSMHVDKLIFLLFIAGEFIDRIIFYIDFEPININNLISKQIIKLINEKKRR